MRNFELGGAQQPSKRLVNVAARNCAPLAEGPRFPFVTVVLRQMKTIRKMQVGIFLKAALLDKLLWLCAALQQEMDLAWFPPMKPEPVRIHERAR